MPQSTVPQLYTMSSCCVAFFKRSYATKTRLTTIFNEDVRQMISREEIKPRKHPGRCNLNAKPFPEDLTNAVQKTIKGGQLKNIMSDSQLLLNYLHSRHSPVEQSEIMEKKQQNRVELEKKYYNENMDEERQIKFEKFINNRVEKLVAQRTYNWKPIDYSNKHVCHQYLLSRIAPEYNVIKTIFSELQQRDPNFAPQSLFDFGSGIGTVTLNAKNIWENSLKEYYCVDSSSTMNDLAKLLLQEGNPNNENILPKGLFYRQFLPASPNLKFDLVVSAYTLFELPDIKNRFETLLNLWNKTKKYIVLVEMGTRAGFNLINEARDLLLEISSQNNTKSHVLSPCPHEHSCPRYDTDDTPCNFEVSYYTPRIAQQSVIKREKFSYVVIRKGERPKTDEQWPRIVRPVLVRSKHSICRMCTSSGKLQEIIFTASKNGKSPRHIKHIQRTGQILGSKNDFWYQEFMGVECCSERSWTANTCSWVPGTGNRVSCHMRVSAAPERRATRVLINSWYQKSFIELTC